ncbi:DUF1573 domain-containing protein [Stieleria marina]|uniref:DUF1573 domain-containing protein n=1 Tax=Stieleria marina TaxID=1930275 RepID=A0A517P2R9_9BACT|nr:hypothetical protein K239x_56950 [Planctomycetes bacterium K23_9]
MAFPAVIFSFLVFAFLRPISGYAEKATTDSAKIQKINRSISLIDGHRHKYSIELGEVSTQVPVDLHFTIFNESSKPAFFDEVAVACSCIKATIPKRILEPGGKLDCRVQIDTNKKQRFHEFVIPIRLLSSDKNTREIAIELTGYLHGFLRFRDRYLTVDVSEQKGTLDIVIPYTATSPIVGDLVAFEHTIANATHRFERAKDRKESWNLILSVERAKIPTQGLASELRLQDFATGRETRMTVLLNHEAPVRISPRSLRLKKRGKSYVGKAILSVLQSSDSSLPTAPRLQEEPEDSEKVPFVSAAINGMNMKVKVTSMNKQHFRVEVQVPVARIEKASASDELDLSKVRWSVVSSTGSHLVSSPVLFWNEE